MSKIICDICGTVYPDNATVCPICGYPRQDNDTGVQQEAAAAVAAAPGVKGGRFSNKNVKKRNSAPEAPAKRDSRREASYAQKEQNPNKSLRGVVAVLLIAVILVGAYIGWRFWNGKDAYANSTVPVIGTNPTGASEEVTENTMTETQPAETGIPCVSLSVSNSEIEFQSAGRGWLLDVKVQPEDTTDEVVFSSSDPSVVTVTQDGRITSVGPGTAVITVVCGGQTHECVVRCTFEAETTEPEESTEPEQTTEPEETTQPEENQPAMGLVLDRTDVTLFKAGESFTFGVRFDGAYVNPNKVTWKSSDENIVKVVDGKVTAVASGTATVTGTYNGKSASCIVRCRFENETTTEPTEPTKPADTSWKINKTDVTIKVGETFSLKVTNDSGDVAEAKWSASRDGVVTIDGNQITGKAAGTVNVTMTVNGVEFTCIVRVLN